MPNQKISALTPATVFNAADVVAIVQAGATLKLSKTLLLTGGVFEDIILKASNGQASRLQSFSGNSSFNVDDVNGALAFSNVGFQATNGGSCNFQFVYASGFLTQDTSVANFVFHWGNAGGTEMQLNDATKVFTVKAANGTNIQYLAAVPANWLAAPPPDLQTAIDRLVAVVAVLNGGPV